MNQRSFLVFATMIAFLWIDGQDCCNNDKEPTPTPTPTDPCEIYYEGDCIHFGPVAYGCSIRRPGSKKSYCWSSCTTNQGNVGYRWLITWNGATLNHLQCDKNIHHWQKTVITLILIFQ